MEGGEEIIYIYYIVTTRMTSHCHHQNDCCIMMGSDESHLKRFIHCEGQISHKTVIISKHSA